MIITSVEGKVGVDDLIVMGEVGLSKLKVVGKVVEVELIVTGEAGLVEVKVAGKSQLKAMWVKEDVVGEDAPILRLYVLLRALSV